MLIIDFRRLAIRYDDGESKRSTCEEIDRKWSPSSLLQYKIGMAIESVSVIKQRLTYPSSLLSGHQLD